MNRAREPVPHPRAIATRETFQSPLYRALHQTQDLSELIGDWPPSPPTGNRADYSPHFIAEVYLRTMNLNTVLDFSSTSVRQASGQVGTTADAACWPLQPSGWLQLCVCTYRSCSQPLPQGVCLPGQRKSARHSHCSIPSQPAPPPLPNGQKRAKGLHVTQKDSYDDPQTTHSARPTDNLQNTWRSYVHIRNASWLREPIMGLASQSERPDIFGDQWRHRSSTPNRRPLK